MLYTKLNMGDGDEITARAMNHMETISEAAISDIATHAHPETYLSKVLADAGYWSTANGAGCNADMLEGAHASELLGTAVGLPIGSMVFWDGILSTIPAHWQHADGTNGTQDMRNYFPVGSSPTHAQGTTYGDNAPKPRGYIGTSGYALTIADIPSHRHGVQGWFHSNNHTPADPSDFQSIYCGGSLTGHAYYPTEIAVVTNSTGSGAAHDHNRGGGWHAEDPIDNRPPYLALYIIERVS